MTGEVRCQLFRSSTQSWEGLTADAAAFATSVGKDKLISISVSEAGGTDAFGVGARGTIFVWYWA